jgi:membrane protein YqaA with SNARE-associated domain
LGPTGEYLAGKKAVNGDGLRIQTCWPDVFRGFHDIIRFAAADKRPWYVRAFRRELMSALDVLHKLLTPSKSEGWKSHAIQIAVLVLTLVISAFIIINYRHIGREYISYGYLGAFVVALISSGSIVLPVPGLAIIAAIGGAPGFNPILVGLIASVGSTLGELTGYGLGFGGRIAVEKIPKYDTVVGWMRKWGSATIFVLSLIPNPIFDVAGIAAGALKFPLWKFLLWGFVGRVPKTIMYAYLGIWFSWLLKIGG